MGPGSASRRSFYPPHTYLLNLPAGGIEPFQLSQQHGKAWERSLRSSQRRKRVIVCGGTLTLLARPRDLAKIALHNSTPENAAGQLRDNSDEISVQQQQLSKKVNGSEQVGV